VGQALIWLPHSLSEVSVPILGTTLVKVGSRFGLGILQVFNEFIFVCLDLLQDVWGNYLVSFDAEVITIKSQLSGIVPEFGKDSRGDHVGGSLACGTSF
jgi:hypothetical protein